MYSLHIIWETILIVLIGTALMRIGGRKSISQMTIAQTVVIISIGKVLIEPVAKKDFGTNFYVAGAMIFVLLLLEFLMLKSRKLAAFIGGRPVVVIQDGEPIPSNMKKLRMTAGELAARLRQYGIENIGDLEFATVDPNGELGYRWSQTKKPATHADIQKLQQRFDKLEELVKKQEK